jgi:hypothetical protein
MGNGVSYKNTLDAIDAFERECPQCFLWPISFNRFKEWCFRKIENESKKVQKIYVVTATRLSFFKYCEKNVTPEIAAILIQSVDDVERMRGFRNPAVRYTDPLPKDVIQIQERIRAYCERP